MRNIDSSIVNAMTTTRQIGARITIRDTLMRFTSGSYSNSIVAVKNGLRNWDADLYGTGILRVANVAGTLYHQYSPDPINSQGTWVSAGGGVKDYSKVALYGGRVFFQRADGVICYRDFNGAGFGTLNTMSHTYTGTAAIAPISSTEVIVLNMVPSGIDIVGYISYHDTGGSYNEWPGMVMNGGIVVTNFDAERVGDTAYIFFTDKDGRRTWTVHDTIKGGVHTWSGAEPVIPLDQVDDTSELRLGHASLINGQLVLTGILTRTGGSSLHVYTVGPEHFTMGRDMVITPGQPGSTYSINFDGGLHTLPNLGMKLLPVGDYICAAGYDPYIYRSDKTMFLGFDNAARKVETDAIANLSMSFESGAPSALSFELASGIEEPVVGSEVTVEASYAGNFGKIGVFDIVAAMDARGEVGRAKSIVGRGNAMGRLSQWVSDASYDYWSQGKQSGNPATLSEFVIASGRWDTKDVLTLKDLNVDGIMYAVTRPSRGNIARLKFRYPSDPYLKPDIGIILQYYLETKEEAARRLEKDIDKVADADLGYRGIGVIWKMEDQRLHLYTIVDSQWAEVNSFPCSLSPDTDYYLLASFFEGAVNAWVRSASSTTYTHYLFSNMLGMNYNEIYKRGISGRCAIYARNNTPHAKCFAVLSDATEIALEEWPAGMPGSTGPVRIDDEVITYEFGIVDHQESFKNLGVRAGYTVADPASTADPKEPKWYQSYHGPFQGHEIYIFPASSTPQSHTIFNNLCLVAHDGPAAGHVFRVTDYDYHAPYQWVPNGNFAYYEPDTWMNHIGDPAHGSWQPSNMRRIFVEKDPSGIITPGVSVGLYGGLVGCTRGAQGTTATSHSRTICSVHTDKSITISEFTCATQEMDMSLEWIATELARKAGVLSVSAEKLRSGNLGFAHAGWSISNDMALSQVNRSSFVMRMKMVSGSEVGVCFNYGSADAKVVSLTGQYVSLYTLSGSTPTLVERIPHRTSLVGWITVSKDRDKCSVWINGRPVAFFPNVGNYEAGSSGIVSNGNATVEVDWPALDQRIDNFVMDMGKSGMGLMQSLIGQKRVFFQDDQDGGLRLFRTRTEVPGLYTLSAEATHSATTASLATRLRLEGAEVHEAFDEYALKRYGNLFVLANNEELESPYEFRLETIDILKDSVRSTDVYALVGAADLRLEPNDIVTTVLPDDILEFKEKDYIVDSVNMNIMMSAEEAILDMEVQARAVRVTD